RFVHVGVPLMIVTLRTSAGKHRVRTAHHRRYSQMRDDGVSRLYTKDIPERFWRPPAHMAPSAGPLISIRPGPAKP
ncbi:hypothetical protein DFP72DRAFT_903435, partial [Ephemerocybe angulata]